MTKMRSIKSRRTFSEFCNYRSQSWSTKSSRKREARKQSHFSTRLNVEVNSRGVAVEDAEVPKMAGLIEKIWAKIISIAQTEQRSNQKKMHEIYIFKNQSSKIFEELLLRSLLILFLQGS